MGKGDISIVVIGQVNSGKSTTIGHIIYQCGGITQSALDDFEKEGAELGKSSMKYAWVLDSTQEERERGNTMDLSLNEVNLGERTVTILDTPGHQDFIKHTISGAFLADCAILVVDADEYETDNSESGQTREHAELAYTLGVRQLIVTINKMDTANWSEGRYLEVVQRTSNLLSKIGFKPKNVPFIPISGWHGDNLIVGSTNMPWYKGWSKEANSSYYSGVTLLEAIRTLETPFRPSDKPLRLPLFDVQFDGTRTMAMGHVETGIIKVGMTVNIAPSDITTRVKSIEWQDKELDKASAGDFVSLTFEDELISEACPGYVCSNAKDNPASDTASFIAQVILLNHPVDIRVGYTADVYCHTTHVTCEFAELIEKIDRRTGKSAGLSPESVRSGEACIAKLIPSDPICVESFNDCPPLSHFAILDDEGRTVGLGVIKSVDKK